MSVKRAGDIMIPIDQYPIVDSSATILEAVTRLDESRRTMKPGRQPFQAVLVADRNGDIVGKMGQLTLLRALDPRTHVVHDQDTLDKAGVSNSIMETALSHYRVLQQGLSEMCTRAAALSVRSVMHPVRENIDADEPIYGVIHKMVSWNTMSILVTRNNQPVGLVRLSDLCDEVIKQMRQTTAGTNAED